MKPGQLYQNRDGGVWNGNKTHCKRGHEFTPANTLITTMGGRSCRACMKERRALGKKRS